ncbi:hypothetical protein [Corynebacterium rouxii]|uniref:Uncharacterized protein n=1 Tax=Corynebacterium rouxii TaxID=2719119 RepID=A0ABU3PL02_9CORY|nr:hypothetical protein [Corynebacterium rouxii]MDT9407953.1 hypothetical protein [Corynebacterium rouxii]MDT9410135.1 hypothetical protein [Corynebacterium rouxii]
MSSSCQIKPFLISPTCGNAAEAKKFWHELLTWLLSPTVVLGATGYTALTRGITVVYALPEGYVATSATYGIGLVFFGTLIMVARLLW